MSKALTFDVRGERGRIQARLAQLGAPDGTSKVLQMAINKVMPSVRSAAGKTLAREMGAPQKFTRAWLRVRNANRYHLGAALRAQTTQVPLIAFRALQTPEGVRYKIGTQPEELLRGGYIARGNSTGKVNVFRRVRKDSRFAEAGRSVGAGAAGPTARMVHAGRSDALVGRYPTFIKYGPSPARVLALELAREVMQTTARERWPIELERALAQYLRSQGFVVDGR